MENPVSHYFLQQWRVMAGWTSGTINALNDEDLREELSPGKNHGVWILGHLIESEDELSVFLGKEPFLFPEYETLFGQGSKLLPVGDYPSAVILREQWKAVLAKNERILSQMTDAEWDEPHARLKEGEDDFFKTKGRCIGIWNLHQNYHNGQLASLLARAGKSKY
jgi:hypothetical protein